MGRPYNYNPENRPVCEICKKRPVARTTHAGKPYWRKYCQTCAKLKYTSKEQIAENSRKSSAKWYLKKKNLKMKPCVLCCFMPKESCQMDWDHIDGNHYNNEPENMQLLCANCHRLKTLINNDFNGYKTRITIDVAQ